MVRIFRRGWLPFFLLLLGLPAGEHVNPEILGDGPESWKSRLQVQGISQIEEVRRGLGNNHDLITIYLDHLQAAARALNN